MRLRSFIVPDSQAELHVCRTQLDRRECSANIIQTKRGHEGPTSQMVFDDKNDAKILGELAEPTQVRSPEAYNTVNIDRRVQTDGSPRIM